MPGPRRPGGATDDRTPAEPIRSRCPACPGETFSFTLIAGLRRAASPMPAPNPSPPALAEAERRLQPQLAALEMLQFPVASRRVRPGRPGLGAAAVAARASAQSAAPAQIGAGLAGADRAVRLGTAAHRAGAGDWRSRVTEKLYDALLNPTHAEAQITLHVLTPDELPPSTADEDRSPRLAYIYTQGLRQAQAVANLARLRGQHRRHAADSALGGAPMFFPGSRYCRIAHLHRDALPDGTRRAGDAAADCRAGRWCWATTAARPASGWTRSPPASSATPPRSGGSATPTTPSSPTPWPRATWSAMPLDAPTGADGRAATAHARRPAGGRRPLHADRVGRGRGEHGPAGRDADHGAGLAQHRRRPDLCLRPAFAPLANVAVVASAGGSGAQGVATGAAGAAAAAFGGGSAPAATQCIFDGYVLSHKLHLETGITNSTLTVWGQDASWLMNLTEKVKEWVDVTDADVAGADLRRLRHHARPTRTRDDDSPSHTEDGHSLMQRGSDIQFLRMLARRNGKVCRVACADQPGAAHRLFRQAEARRRSGRRRSTLNDPQNWTVSALDLEWDATRPTAVIARAGAVQRQRPERRDRPIPPTPA